jgi:hypothetical protein
MDYVVGLDRMRYGKWHDHASLEGGSGVVDVGCQGLPGREPRQVSVIPFEV